MNLINMILLLVLLSSVASLTLPFVTSNVDKHGVPYSSEKCNANTVLDLSFSSSSILTFGSALVFIIVFRLIHPLLRSDTWISLAMNGPIHWQMDSWLANSLFQVLIRLFCLSLCMVLIPSTWPCPSSMQRVIALPTVSLSRQFNCQL
jgi:hypothetical protein